MYEPYRDYVSQLKWFSVSRHYMYMSWPPLKNDISYTTDFFNDVLNTVGIFQLILTSSYLYF